MLSDILRGGFTRAHHRPGLIILDFFWKAIWFLVTMAIAAVAAVWVTSDIRAIQWDPTGIRVVDTFIATAILREFWNAHTVEVLTISVGVLLISCSFWTLLEALCRRRIVIEVTERLDAQIPLAVFVASALLKYVVLSAAGFLLLLASFEGALWIAVVTLAGMTFFLTLIDSLIRADAVDLLGTDLFRVAGLVGILMSFELLIGSSIAVLFFTSLLRIARPIDAVTTLGAAAAGVVFLTLVHSYLLLVRFSAIAIMRQNVIEV